MAYEAQICTAKYPPSLDNNIPKITLSQNICILYICLTAKTI